MAHVFFPHLHADTKGCGKKGAQSASTSPAKQIRVLIEHGHSRPPAKRHHEFHKTYWHPQEATSSLQILNSHFS